MQKYTEIYRNIQKYTEIYRNMQKYTEIYRNLQCRNIQKYTKICRNMQSVFLGGQMCKNIQKYAATSQPFGIELPSVYDPRRKCSGIPASDIGETSAGRPHNGSRMPQPTETKHCSMTLTPLALTPPGFPRY